MRMRPGSGAPAGGGGGTLGQSTRQVSQAPTSIAAAARHTMPAPVAPPRSTTSPKFARTPRYSAAADGPNIGDSQTGGTSRPSTSPFSIPASARAPAASSAQASSMNIGRSQTRSGFHSASPATAAARRPTPRPSEHAVGAELRDRLGAAAELAHHLVRVLAEERRAARDPPRRLLEAVGRPGVDEAPAELRVLDRRRVAARDEVRVGERLLRRIDDTDRE